MNVKYIKTEGVTDFMNMHAYGNMGITKIH